MNSFNQSIDSITDPAKLEKVYISSVSFVPTFEEMEVLLSQSNKAIETARHQISSNVLSKIQNLIPKSFNPNDTILNKGAFQNAQKTGDYVELKNGYLYVINDRDIPFISKSNGPNGILVNCHGYYGKDRINLFHKNEKNVFSLLNDYIKARDKNINYIFTLFVKKLKTFAATGNTTVDNDMFNVIAMFDHILQHLENYSLSYFGIDVVSLCQTWMRKGDANEKITLSLGPAQFSVMSPHFQTKFYVKNTHKLQKVVDQAYIDSYVRVMRDFTKRMQSDYGAFGETGGQAFVNLDKLYKRLK